MPLRAVNLSGIKMPTLPKPTVGIRPMSDISTRFFDPTQVILPSLPGIRLPELPGMTLPNLGLSRNIRGVTQPPGLQPTPGLPVRRQTGANDTGFVIQRDSEGNIDWFNTIAQAGSLAAMAVGAARGNIPLAAAGSGFLQGRAQGLEQRAALGEREAVRAEAKAEREQEKAQAAIARVESAISRKEWGPAEENLTQITDEATREAWRNRIGEARTAADAEKAKNDDINAERFIAGIQKSSDGFSVEKTIRKLYPDNVSAADRAHEIAVELQAKERKIEAEERAARQDTEYARIHDDIRNMNLATVDLARKRVDAARLAPELKDSLHQSINEAEEELKITGSFEKGMKFFQRQEFERALPLLQVGMEDPTLTVRDVQRMYYRPMEKFIERVEKRLETSLSPTVSDYEKKKADIEKQEREYIEKLTGIPFNEWTKPLENRPQAEMPILDEYVRQAAEDVLNGKLTIEAQLQSTRNAIGKTDLVPDLRMAEEINKRIQSRVQKAQPSVSGPQGKPALPPAPGAQGKPAPAPISGIIGELQYGTPGGLVRETGKTVTGAAEVVAGLFGKLIPSQTLNNIPATLLMQLSQAQQNELAQIADPAERLRRAREMVSQKSLQIR